MLCKTQLVIFSSPRAKFQVAGNHIDVDQIAFDINAFARYQFRAPNFAADVDRARAHLGMVHFSGDDNITNRLYAAGLTDLADDRSLYD